MALTIIVFGDERKEFAVSEDEAAVSDLSSVFIMRADFLQIEALFLANAFHELFLLVGNILHVCCFE